MLAVPIESPKSETPSRTSRRTRRHLIEDLEPRHLLATDPLYFPQESLSAVGSGTTHENGTLENDLLGVIGWDIGSASTLPAGFSSRVEPNVYAAQLDENILNALFDACRISADRGRSYSFHHSLRGSGVEGRWLTE